MPDDTDETPDIVRNFFHSQGRRLGSRQLLLEEVKLKSCVSISTQDGAAVSRCASPLRHVNRKHS